MFLRPQRTQTIRQCLRQHRHHPIRQIDRVAALARFDVERPNRAQRSGRHRRSQRRSRQPPFGRGRQNTASSKSRASSPSIVTSEISVTSSRSPCNVGSTRSGKPRTASSTSAGHSTGTPCARNSVVDATRKSSRAAITSTTRPISPKLSSPVTSTATVSPSAASPWPPAREIRDHGNRLRRLHTNHAYRPSRAR